MITVYAYDANTKEHIGMTQAQESPLQPGVILMPANSTKVPQPAVIGEKQTAVWNSSGWWDIIADLRGTVYYDADGKEYTQKELGNLPEWALSERPVIPEPEPTQEEQLRAYSNAVQDYLNSVAQSKGYDNCYTCLSYLSSTNETWRTESNIYNVWRDTCWLKCHEVLAKWQAEQISQPTVDELIFQLPEINW